MKKKLYVIGVAQAIYALSVIRKEVEEVVLVSFHGFEGASGARKFAETTRLVSSVCKILGIDFSEMPVDILRKIAPLESNQFVDVGVSIRLGRENRFLNPIHFACQVEHVNIMRPSLLHGINYSLVKRFDLLRKIVLPLGIREFYSLAPRPKIGLILTEKIIDRVDLKLLREEIVLGLRKNRHYYWLKTPPFDKKSKAVIALPFASHFGGSEYINRRIFEIAIERAYSSNTDLLIVKNHPSDESQYEFFFENLKTQGIQICFMQSQSHRTFPLELLIECFEGIQFVGAESTAIMTTPYDQIRKPVIVEEVERRSERHRNYDIGEIRNLYEAERLYL
jgi:hypothetical protein